MTRILEFPKSCVIPDPFGGSHHNKFRIPSAKNTTAPQPADVKQPTDAKQKNANKAREF